MKQTYPEKTATVQSNWLSVEEYFFCLGSRGCRLVAIFETFVMIRSESFSRTGLHRFSMRARPIAPRKLPYNPFNLVSLKQLSYSTSKSVSSSYVLFSEELRTELGLTSKLFAFSLSAIQIDCLQYSTRDPPGLYVTTALDTRPQTPRFLHFEPPPFKMQGRYSNLDLKYEFSASNST